MPPRWRHHVWIATLMVVACGCGQSGKSTAGATYREQPEAKKQDDPLVRTVNLGGGGSGTRLGPEPKREKLWTVNWKEARVTMEPGNSFSGTMEAITGLVFEDGKEASTFSADRGMADKSDDVLAMNGDVRVTSKENGTTLHCRHLEYRPHQKLVRALGDVKIDMPNGTIDAGQEVLATPDLKSIASPGMFKR